MAVIIKGIDKIEQSAETNSLEWAWQNDGPADGEVLIFGENGQLTNGQPVADISAISATGGTESTFTDSDGQTWKIHAFTTDGTFSVTGDGSVEYLVIAGGGAGGCQHGGGGGAGGYRSSCSIPGEKSGGGQNVEPPLSVTTNDYNIVVGDGGASLPAQSMTGVIGSNGQPSAIQLNGVDIIKALGGGGGSSLTPNGVGGISGADGGSGGGTALYRTDQGTMDYPMQGGSSINGNGHDGGQSNGWTNYEYGGGSGGGGAGGAGEQNITNSGSSTRAGGGGVGLDSAISGSLVSYAGGGGGGAHSPWGLGTVSHGGGAGALTFSDNGSDGQPNTGGGGGGSGSNSTVSGAGGSGIVVIRYKV